MSWRIKVVVWVARSLGLTVILRNDLEYDAENGWQIVKALPNPWVEILS
jgi:hypothetical protein